MRRPKSNFCTPEYLDLAPCKRELTKYTGRCTIFFRTSSCSCAELFLSGPELVGAAPCLSLDSLAGLLDGKYFLLALSPVIPPPALLCRGGVVAVTSTCASILPGEFPPLFCVCALISQSVELADIPNLGHGHFFSHAAVTHVLVERADNHGRVDVGDVAMYTAEALDVPAQGFSFLLGQNVEIALLAVGLVAAREGANKLMAKICPRG